MCSGSVGNVRVPRYAISLLVSAVVTAGVLSGLLLFVFRTGWAGAAGILSGVGIFLAWFYNGRRPDLETEKERK